MPTTAASLETGLQLHQAGRLREAEVIYRQVLAAEPDQADALHLLGLLAYQAGQQTAALRCIEQAVAIQPDQPVFRHNLGEVYRAMGKLPDACGCYRQALELNGSLPKAHHSLAIVLRKQGDALAAAGHFRQAIQLDGQWAAAHADLGATLASLGELAEAAASFARAAELAPGDSSFQANLGAVYQRQGKLDEAIACYRAAIGIDPKSAQAHHNLAVALKDCGRLDESIDASLAALALQPDLIVAHYNLALARHERGERAAAGESYRRVLSLDPRHVDALCNYGNLIQLDGKFDEALEYYRRAIELRPDFAPAHFGRGNALQSKNLKREAAEAFREAVRLEPGYFEAYNNLAMVLNSLVEADEAVEACLKGLELKPDSGELHANMATALQMQGRGAEAVAAHRKAIELRPHDAAEFSNLLFCLNFRPEYDPPTRWAEHLEWGRRFAEPLTAQARPHASDRSREGRLRIGYMSPFFRQHAVNYFSEPLIRAHDRQNFEVFCYSDVAGGDEITERIKSSVDAWRDVRDLSDDDVAALVRRDRIDIFVDLTGHIGENRLLIFARKPAPIQVTYLGYQNTTGMTAMDYRLTDAFADPPGLTDAHYTEKLVRLPRAFFCYQPAESPDISELPALKSGHVTFGSFNNVAKMSEPALAAWLEILRRVPDSRLLLLGHRGGTLENNLHRRVAAAGIAADRVEICGRQPHWQFLEMLARADLALDPFPFNGHTTTCDLVWMGVPVVMLLGATYAERFGGSVLTNVGLGDWMATSIEQYIEMAVAWANNLETLGALRLQLRERMRNSPLLDFAGFARDVEGAYREMWVRWCNSQPE